MLIYITLIYNELTNRITFQTISKAHVKTEDDVKAIRTSRDPNLNVIRIKCRRFGCVVNNAEYF